MSRNQHQPKGFTEKEKKNWKNNQESMFHRSRIATLNRDRIGKIPDSV